jgi:hypothetical protein
MTPRLRAGFAKQEQEKGSTTELVMGGLPLKNLETIGSMGIPGS